MNIGIALLITLVVWVITWAEAWFAYPMVNTPLVLCPVVGLILGDLQAGVIAGATLQLIFLGVMQIGGTLPADASLGAVIGTAFSITMGQDVETALTFAVPIAVLGSTLTLLKYIINGLVNPYVEKLCEKGDVKGIERVHILVSFLPDLPKMLVLFAALAFGTGFAQGLIDAIPEVVQSGLDYATNLMPAVGIALLLKMMWSGRMAVYFFLGVVLVSYFNAPILAVACVGVILAVIIIMNEGKAAPAGQAAQSVEEELFND
ncbi:MAG: PTS sugar transporter subunit IIC [Ruminococcus sp.]|jgi:mannose/fructose/N-acetylgalactosamine-specific phosphotransferase system component IIC|uniref:PTS sugar transporter subunit IIC n=1 Tax=Schaedlerella arabinosiphila TaxID=2044587 RepID=A0A3R8LFZ5_9FIRM|nr:PTS sugar transporter subunit IIC [Schaedlerella arabinosiphila]MCI8722748.1 PTS sugar transporter subunit IIC [Ruminococcus sp.]MCI9211548.1 PTS sugar transporter subunit IIC [Ruminococcus sp.]MCI9631682.1 PTS sugar transporter subunit IIC [Ruminococcus sp.]RRK32535.1 PTS sugar transporter subunit IIC [Schaedlerella arabinosiphila]